MGLWNFIRFGFTSFLSSNGEDDKIKSTPGKAGSPQGQETFGRYFPWGYDARMPTGGNAVLVSPQGGSNLACVGARHDKYPPDYADENWTAILHNEKSGTWVKLRKDGGVQISANGGAGFIEITSAGQIKLGGDAVAVIKSGDRVFATADMIAWMVAVGAVTMVGPGPAGATGLIGTAQSNATKLVTGS